MIIVSHPLVTLLLLPMGYMMFSTSKLDITVY
nr:MAG TPA_asm: hypothetical protein [Caudoviricetes sp.]